MRIAYIEKNFSASSLATISQAIDICETYAADGYDLTLRQLYYQFVSRDLIANSQREYKRLGSVINDARMAGYLDWDFIVDRTRNVEIPSAWDNPSSIVQAAAQSYRVARWAGQQYQPEVWVEKDALGGVIDRATSEHRVPWFSCRGYTSQSEIWGAAQRLGRYLVNGQVPVILHLGDHDPSGIDMTRDIIDRLNAFMLHDWAEAQGWMWELENEPDVLRTHMAEWIEEIRELDRNSIDDFDMPVLVRRIALNMDQVRVFNPPPNPTKFTDSRSRSYIAEHGYESWELDALEPTVLNALIRQELESFIDQEVWNTTMAREQDGRDRLAEMAKTIDFRTDEEMEEEE